MSFTVSPISRLARTDPWTIVVVSTCRRKGVQYLPRTLVALERTGAESAWQRLILSDGAPPPDCSWTVISNGKDPSGGCLANLWRAFRIALEAKAERLLYFEDDVLPCANAVTHALRLEVPEKLAFIDLCDVKEVPEKAPSGIYEIPLGEVSRPYHGTLAMLFPRRTLEYLARYPEGDAEKLPNVLAYVNPSAGRTPHRMCDIVLGAVLGLSPWPRYGVHIPCLVEHVGEVSSIYEKETLRKGRLATNFHGESFDALSL